MPDAPLTLADRLTAFALLLGRNIDWLAAAVVVAAYFALDQGWIVLSPETIAGALAFMAALRGYVEKYNRSKSDASEARGLALFEVLIGLALFAAIAISTAKVIR